MGKLVNQTVMVIMSVLAITACSTTTNKTASSVTLNTAVKAAGLPAQALQQGKCAIFLWEEKQGRPLVFFQPSDSDIAKIYARGDTFEVKRTRAENETVEGLFMRQHFTGEAKEVQLRLQPSPGKNMIEGIRIPNGVMTITEKSGSQLIIAVSGLYGCKI